MIPMEPVPWPKVKGQPRISGVSSFGITGTDGHVIIQEAPDYELPKFSLGLERPTHIVKISGKTGEALDELLKSYENLFSERSADHDKTFANAAFSSNVGRASFNHRAFVVANNYEDAAKLLKEKKNLQGEVTDGENRQICFLFTGQGSQYQRMARSLYETSPIFRINFDTCDRILRKIHNLSIKQVLWESDPSSKELSRTIYSQTSIFCIEYCLFKLWQSWGVTPDYVLGHSLGEFCAAVAAGVLDFKDALKLIAERSRLIDNLPRGSMLVIKASKPEVDKLLKTAKMDLDFAAVNNPDQTVLAGDIEKVEQFLAYLEGQGIKAIILEATHAFHSRHMDPMLEKYRKIAETVKFKGGNGHTQYVSGMEGRIIENSSELGADYWVRHTREKVSFVEACVALRETGCQDYLEVGPQPILSSFVMMNNEHVQLNCLPSIRRGTDDWQTILTSLGKLYLLGYKIDWKGYDDPYKRNKVSLPYHPLQKKSFWVECGGGQAAMIHPLVGYPVNNASALNIFQNDLNLKSVPYIKDHCIGERIIFPGAGYTEMCLSAGYLVANGLTETLEPPRRAMRLENLRIEAPLELREEKLCRLQVIVDLPEQQQEDDQSDNQGFRVKVYHQNTSDQESGKWVLHASSTFKPAASTKESMKHWNHQRISEIISNSKPKTTEAFYKSVDDAGLRFGEKFRMIQRYWSVKQTDVKMEVDEVVAEMQIPSDFNKYLLHPLIIDAVFQSGILSKVSYEESKLKVPVRIGQLTMFSGIKNCEENGSIYIHVWYENDNYFIFISTANGTPIALVEDVELITTNVKTIESVLEQQSSSIPDSWEETWKVIPSPFSSAVELVDTSPVFEDPQVLNDQQKSSANAPEVVDTFLKLRKLLCLYILNAFLELGWKPKSAEMIDLTSFCKELGIQPEFYKLVRFYFTVLEAGAGILQNENESWRVSAIPLSHGNVKLEINKLQDFLEGVKFATLGVYENIAKSLSKILIGEESALTLLFPTDENNQQFSAVSYYQDHPGRLNVLNLAGTCCRAIFKHIHSANSNDPGKIYRVLEVGSGTGSLSVVLLAWLKESWGDRFEFYYTDISQSFFIKAVKKLEEYAQNIKYAVFNVEESPLSQGIPLNYFDMVCATDVFHATKSLEKTLTHVRQTLRPGGLLCFTETITQSTDTTFVFGPLNGYWRYEDFHWRPHHCCVGVDVWEQILNQCGFKIVSAPKACVDEFACIAAIADPEAKISSLKSIQESCKEWVIFSEGNSFEVTCQVAEMLKASGNKVVTVVKSSDQQLSKEIGDIAIRADNEDPTEIEKILVDGKVQGIIYAWGMDMNERDQKNVALPFMHIVKTVLGLRKPPQLYVLTKGVHAVLEDSVLYHPTAATLYGMIKSLKNENLDLFVRYVYFEQDSEPSAVVDQVLFELAMNSGAKESQRVQVAYRGNVRYEPRLVKGNLPTPNDMLKLPLSTDRYHLVLPKSRMIQDLEFDILEEELIGENEVEVKVRSFALNFKDILTILKPSAEFEQLNTVGLDFAGIVTKIGGSGSSGHLNVGDRVFGVNFKEAQLPSHIVLDSKSVLRIPDNMTFWEASTLPAVFSTAYYCLVTIAKMGKGDTVLIHTATGGVGLAAIQLAKHVGANIIATAGNPRKRAYLRSLGIEHVFHSRNASFEKDILRVTNGRGVDVVLNSITGPGIKEATLNASANNARFVEMSKLSIWTPDEVKALRPDVDYRIIDLTVLEPEKWGKLLTSMEEFLAKGQLKAIPYVKFDALNIRQALQYFQKAKHIGKVVSAMPEVTKKEGQFKVKVTLFNSESTYLITGGLGGIGVEVCKWMLGLGATDIVLVGRSPPKPEVNAQLKEMNQKGVNVAVKLGDVADYDHCKAILDSIAEDKPLRGVMHCAGILRDNLYANQTWESFQATFTPKVAGTWNLHNLTKDLPLEHFILYSSMTALLGTPSQSNHAAANCFQDAFIHYRHSVGLPGTTINWGQWAQVGVAKEINVFGVLPVSVKRMLNGLELVMKTPSKKQVGFSDFESLTNFGIMCPLAKYYIDDRLWKQLGTNTQSSEQAINAGQFWKEMDQKETTSEKIDVFSVYLKAILRSALRLEPDEPLHDDVPIQQIGVDSLMLIELRNSIQSLLGSRLNVTASLLKNCNTVRLFANAVVGKLLEEDEQEENQTPLEPLPPSELLQLLNGDCILDENILAPSVPPTKPSGIKTILVTGATGQLAPYIITQLTKSFNSVEKIVCLIRGATDDSRSAIQKMKATLSSMNLETAVDMSRLECVSGDVTMERLGILQDKYQDLCEGVDAIIHCAGKINHAEHYRRATEKGKLGNSRSVNVGGTLNVLKFASTLKTKHVYFPSSFICGAFDENEEGTLTDEWPKSYTVQTIVDSKLPGLTTSKFICEILLQQANRRGIPCKVFRFPWIAGESGSGRLNYLNNLYILRYLSFLKINAMPSLIVPANLLPVDICADMSLKLFFNDEAPYQVFNIGHPKPQVEQEFVKVAKEEFGKDLEVLDWKEFAQRLQDNNTEIDTLKDLYGDQRLMSIYLSDVAGFVKGYLVSPDTFFNNKKVKKYIPNYGEGIPSSMDIVRRDLNFLKSTGFLEKFGI